MSIRHESDVSSHAFFSQSTGNSTIDADLKYIRDLDWSTSSIGPIESWPPELLVLINLALLSPQPQLFLLGPDAIILYNTAYGELLRDHHPLYQCRPIELNSALIANAPAIDRIVDRATTKEQPANENRVTFFFRSNGRLEEVFLSATMVQLPRSLGGYHATTYETTAEAVQKRRDHALGQISRQISQAVDLDSVWSSFMRGLSLADQDIPFAVLYCADSQVVRDSETGAVRRDVNVCNFHLEGSVGTFSTPPSARIQLNSTENWIAKLREASSSHESVLLKSIEGALPDNFCSASTNRCHGDHCDEAIVLPSTLAHNEDIYCLLIVGIAPRRPFDDVYQYWVRTLNQTLANLVATVTIAEQRAFSRENELLRVTKEREIFTKELSLKKQEAALATGKIQRMLGIMQSANVGVFECLPSGQLIEMNESCSKLCGRPHIALDEDAPSIFDLCYADDIASLEKNWKLLVSGEALNFPIRFQYSAEGVDSRWVQLSCLPVRNDVSDVKTIIGCVTDISPQKKVEEEVKRAEAMEQVRLREARIHETRLLQEAIEAKRQQENFIDMTSHEIRNPLNVVVHSVEALTHTISEMKVAMNDAAAITESSRFAHTQKLSAYFQECSETIDTIMSCTMHQKRIADDILSLSKLDSDLLEIFPTVFNIGDFLNQISNTFVSEAGRAGVTIEASLDSSLSNSNITHVKADPGRLTQVLVNLVSNAIKFTKDKAGDRIVAISVGVSEPSSNALADFVIAMSTSLPQANTEVVKDKYHLWFKVTDTGCGMNSVERAKIFTRFTQASPKTYNTYGGSGLGLFVSMKLVNLQGGQIGFLSEEGSGSRFAFYVEAFRASPPSMQAPPLARNRSDHESSHRLNPSVILLVEDNLVNQKVLQKQLVRHGFVVHTADNGQQALDFVFGSRHSKRAAHDSTRPILDVILMDIEMPIMNGLDCARNLRIAEGTGELTKHIPIVAVTANARPEQLRQAVEAGMDDSISKPFHIRDLKALLRRLDVR